MLPTFRRRLELHCKWLCQVRGVGGGGREDSRHLMIHFPPFELLCKWLCHGELLQQTQFWV